MRETVICFRTSEDLRKAVQKIADDDRRSLSSVIEHALYLHVEMTGPKVTNQEKRRYPRKSLSTPALITGSDGTVHTGVVQDVSLGGVHLTLPAGPWEEESKISVVFALPQSERPLTLQCTPRYLRSNGEMGIGAAFVDADFQSYRSLQDYLTD